MITVTQMQQIIGVASDGIVGPKTKAALVKWQAAHGLEPDGIAGPLTTAAMQSLVPKVAEPLGLMLRALEIALVEAKARVRETDGPNDSPRIRQYQAVCHIAPPEPYCAAFVCWCICQACQQLSLPAPIRFSAYTPDLYRRCKPISSYEVQPGDLFFVYKPHLDGGRIGHVGIVASLIEDGRFSTVEANTNIKGSRDGDGVYANFRRADETIYFARVA